jgi:hypothetical protein
LAATALVALKLLVHTTGPQRFPLISAEKRDGPLQLVAQTDEFFVRQGLGPSAVSHVLHDDEKRVEVVGGLSVSHVHMLGADGPEPLGA